MKLAIQDNQLNTNIYLFSFPNSTEIIKEIQIIKVNS
jgi:hypothetical protein